jgi:hypothetical protein
MAGEQKYTVDIGVTGLTSLTKLQNSVDVVHQRMMSLRTVIASGLFAGLGAGALRMADDMQDLSNATGIATGRLLEFKKALVENGGAADQMAQGITTFVRSIDEAAQGSLKAQNTFRDLGITMTDLQTLSEQELMVKALKGIGGIEDASRRAAILMDLFGKSFRTVDAKGLADGLERTAGSADKYAAAIKRGAELNDALATAGGNVKLAFLEAFSPVIAALNTFNTATAEGSARMNALITAIKLAGAALVTAFSASVLLSLVSSIGVVLRGISAIGVALGSAALPAWLIASTGAVAKFLPALRAVALLISAGLGIYAATQLFDDFGSIAVNALSRITEGILDMAGSLLNLPTDAVAGLMNIFGAGIKDPKGLGTPFLMAKDALESLRKKHEETTAANKKLQDETRKTGKTATDLGDKINRAVDTTAWTNAVNGIQKVGAAYEENGRRILENIQLETQSIGNSKQANDLEAARLALANRTYDTVQQLRDAQASMSAELKNSGLGAVYDAEIAKVQELGRAELLRLTNLVNNLAKVKAAEELRLFGIKAQYDAEDKLLGIQREMADLTLTDIEKKYRDISRAADDSAKAAIRAEEARRGEKLNPSEVEAYYKKAREGTDSVVSAQKRLNDQSRLFSTGWRKAFNDYVDNATNAAQTAARVFDKFTSGLEDALVDFAKTGEFVWQGFVNSMLEELLRSQIRETIAGLGSAIGLGDLFGGGGGAANARGSSANNPMYVIDVAGGGGGANLIGSMSSGGGIGGGGGGIGDLISSAGSWINENLFGGFFANGGAIPAGKFGMVGENGPELAAGPATIMPMGGGGGSVTYNINAVDARSFQALLAQDPGFVHAVVQQGARGTPQRR